MASNINQEYGINITEDKLAGILSSHRLLPGAKLAGSLASPRQINPTCDDNDVAGRLLLLNENSTLISGLTEAVIATNVSVNQILQSGTLLDEELPNIMEETVQELHSPIGIMDEKSTDSIWSNGGRKNKAHQYTKHKYYNKKYQDKNGKNDGNM